MNPTTNPSAILAAIERLVARRPPDRSPVVRTLVLVPPVWRACQRRQRLVWRMLEPRRNEMNPTVDIPFHVLDEIAADCGIDLPAGRARAIADEIADATDAELLRLAWRGGPADVREAARGRHGDTGNTARYHGGDFRAWIVEYHHGRGWAVDPDDLVDELTAVISGHRT